MTEIKVGDIFDTKIQRYTTAGIFPNMVGAMRALTKLNRPGIIKRHHLGFELFLIE